MSAAAYKPGDVVEVTPPARRRRRVYVYSVETHASGRLIIRGLRVSVRDGSIMGKTRTVEMPLPEHVTLVKAGAR